jgi:small nuclear ribonucleoprotein (snRNP)-like protein
MIDYMQYEGTLYSEKEVEACLSLVNTFLTDIEETNSKEEGMKLVKKVVLKLNDLNEKYEEALIETDLRELLADIINSASVLKGYSIEGDDITEEWSGW